MLLLSVGAALGADAGIGLTELPLAAVSVPTAAPPERAKTIRVDGPFRLVGVVQGVRAYEAPLPVRPRALFFDSPPEGMSVKRGSIPFKFAGDIEDGVRPGTWQFTADSITVRVKPDAPPPRAGELTLTYTEAEAREDALWRARSDATSDAAFVVRSAQVDDVTRRGVYLPAPASAAWDVAVPQDGVLRLDLGILPPEIADGTTSDGATLTVKVDGAVVATARARVRDFAPLRVPLSAYAGRTVRLSLETSDADTTRDHVFVAAPAIYGAEKAPKRAVLVFVDTLRRDHLGVYGATRGASPHIDAFAQSAVVFDDARSVAPWTLPSSRSALSGVQPEFWKDAKTLPVRLAEKGWATAAYVGNVYLSSNFDMSGGWGEHGCVNWPYGRLEVDRALDFLARHPDQDALVMVHFMDMHLPYKEPWSYRNLYEGTRPAGLFEGFNRNTLLAASKGNRDKVRDYLVARYDQNLRYVDDQVDRLVRAVGDDATVVLFADHGEEFFDHGDLEHGHTLYDELLRIPMMVRAPGLAPRHVPSPVSLLDLTPTVLDLLGLGDPSLQGHSLLAAARGDADPALDHRALAFGRPLYGNEAWGSLKDGLKYISRSGKELLFDLGKDRGEQANLRPDGDPAPGRAALAEGLGRDAAIAYRVTARGKGAPFAVELHVPGGIALAWVGDDPTKKSAADLERLDDQTIRATFRSTRGNHREIFVVPKGDAVADVASVTVRVSKPGLAAVPLADGEFDGYGGALAKVEAGGHSAEVTYAVVPVPAGEAASGASGEQTAGLCALGYLDDCGNDEK